MADEPTGMDNSSTKKNQSGGDFTKFASAAGAIVGVLVGLYTLTGFNPLKDIFPGDSAAPPTTTSPAAPTTTPSETWTPPPVTPLPLPPLVPTPEPDPPFFIVEDERFIRPCNGGCPMTAIFSNIGGNGSVTATFDVQSKDGEHLVSCSVVVPYTLEGEATSAGCNAFNIRLRNYFRANPGGEVFMSVTVNNP